MRKLIKQGRTVMLAMVLGANLVAAGFMVRDAWAGDEEETPCSTSGDCYCFGSGKGAQCTHGDFGGEKCTRQSECTAT